MVVSPRHERLIVWKTRFKYSPKKPRCQLSTVNCQLSTVNCQLSTANCQLLF
ncbi:MULTISPECIES: hypothetical protein [unclassified Microcoleus]|uniref:hypothetical protein n=1 Tax=unclassified Microcoleus TaxID=2642155 RepID=UPI0025E2BF11|nr:MULTISPECIES: hypothetical protein [unclassified Microcoleus]